MADTEAVIRRYFGAVQSGDRSELDAIFSDEIIYRYPGRSPYANTYRGKQEIFDYIDRLGADLEGSLTISVDEILTKGERAVALVRPRASRKGRELEWGLVIVFRVSDGEIQEIQLHYADQHAFDEFITA
jgi:ketosteroid isomerase-like protein